MKRKLRPGEEKEEDGEEEEEAAEGEDGVALDVRRGVPGLPARVSVVLHLHHLVRLEHVDETDLGADEEDPMESKEEAKLVEGEGRFPQGEAREGGEEEPEGDAEEEEELILQRRWRGDVVPVQLLLQVRQGVVGPLIVERPGVVDLLLLQGFQQAKVILVRDEREVTEGEEKSDEEVALESTLALAQLSPKWREWRSQAQEQASTS